jgi:hypothetical protein
LEGEFWVLKSNLKSSSCLTFDFFMIYDP